MGDERDDDVGADLGDASGSEATGAPAGGVEGGAFDPGLPDGRSAVTLDVAAGALRARPHGGGAALTLPLAGLAVEVGGADGDVVFCRHPSAPGRCLHGRGAAMRDLLAPHLDAAGAAALAKVRLQPRRLWPRLVGLALGLAATLWLLSASMGVVAGWIPFAVDGQIGRAAKPLVLADATGRVVTDKVVVAGVDEVMRRVVAASERPELRFDLTVVRSEDVNAFALPGGVVVVYTGLIDKCASADALAAVLAHEWTHVTRRHGMRKIGQNLGLVVLFEVIVGDVAGLAQTVAELYSLGQMQSYSRELEEESDAEAVHILARAGLDPAAVATFFATLKAASPDTDPGLLEWVSSHPAHDARIDAAKAIAATPEVQALRPKRPPALKTDWAALRAALKR